MALRVASSSAQAGRRASAVPALSRRRPTVSVRAVDGGLMKKPEAPPKRPEPPKLFAEGGEPAASGAAAAAAAAASTSAAAAAAAAAPPLPLAPTGATGVTVEYQRQRAKEMRAFLQRQAAYKVQEQESSGFGWTRAAERSNGRWVMFGFAVGLLTEFATGVDFPQQLRLMLSYLGIADME